MNKKIMILTALLVLGLLFVTGCQTSGNYDYSNRQQQAPVGGGCGITAPLSEEVSEGSLNVDKSAF